MIQMPWTEETFPFFLCKIWNKRQPKNTSLKQFLCPFDNENWKETYKFGYVGGPLSMLTLMWPHKNHWKLFDGSRDLKNTLKGNCNMHYEISEMPSIKNEFPRAEGPARALLLCPDLSVPKTLHVFTLGHTFLSSTHAPWLFGSLFQKFPRPILPSVACKWLKSM